MLLWLQAPDQGHLLHLLSLVGEGAAMDNHTFNQDHGCTHIWYIRRMSVTFVEQRHLTHVSYIFVTQPTVMQVAPALRAICWGLAMVNHTYTTMARGC